MTSAREAPVITAATSKGGAGKTTKTLGSAYSLALVKGLDIGIVDADPQQSAALFVMRSIIASGQKVDAASPTWTYRPEGGKGSVTVYRDAHEPEKFNNLLKQARKSHQVVMLDLQGSSNDVGVYAMAQSDLIIVVTQSSEFDEMAVRRTVTLAEQASAVARREIPVRVLMNRISGLDLKVDRETAESLRSRGYKLMVVELGERPLLRTMTKTGRFPLRDSKDKGERKAAINLINLALEELSILDGSEAKFHEKYIRALQGQADKPAETETGSAA